VLFDLPGYRVVAAVDLPDGRREVTIEAVAAEEGCPDCGVLSDRVHQRMRQRLRDVPVAGRVEVVLVKRRFACGEPACSRRTFVEVSEQVPVRARITTGCGSWCWSRWWARVGRSRGWPPSTAC
jgi:transposase